MSEPRAAEVGPMDFPPVRGARRLTLLRSPAAAAAAAVLVLAVAAAVAAPALAPHNPLQTDLLHRLLPPGSPGFPLGTDPLGRDLLSRIIFGARISLLVGGLSTLGAGIVGLLAGVVAGYFGPVCDEILMRLADVVLSFPFLLLALAIIAAIGPSIRNLVLVLVVRNWVTYARITRAQVLETKQLAFVEAAEALGASRLRLLTRHILPRVTGAAAVVASFTMAEAMIAEASLSFLGAGIPPPAPSWGGMLHDNLLYIASAWWTIVLPACALTLVILALNVLGDWVRDVMDPSSRA